MATQFTLDQGRLRSLLQQEATRVVRDGQRKVLNSAKLRSPVDTGQLRASHRSGHVVVTGDKVSADIVAEQDYSLAVHEGSRPHVIRPRRARVLTWGKGAGRVFATSVNHPGSRPRPWLLNALKDEGPRLGFVVSEG